MSPHVCLVEASLGIPDALRLLVESGSRCLIVTDAHDQTLGIVTDGDLIPLAVRLLDPDRHLARRQVLRAGPNFLDSLLERKRSRTVRVEDVMHHPVTSADASMTVGQVATIMVVYEQGHVPVTDGGRVVGLVSSRDVITSLCPAA